VSQTPQIATEFSGKRSTIDEGGGAGVQNGYSIPKSGFLPQEYCCDKWETAQGRGGEGGAMGIRSGFVD
jgi:hypothetical protein